VRWWPQDGTHPGLSPRWTRTTGGLKGSLDEGPFKKVSSAGGKGSLSTKSRCQFAPPPDPGVLVSSRAFAPISQDQFVSAADVEDFRLGLITKPCPRALQINQPGFFRTAGPDPPQGRGGSCTICRNSRAVGGSSRTALVAAGENLLRRHGCRPARGMARASRPARDRRGSGRPCSGIPFTPAVQWIFCLNNAKTAQARDQLACDQQVNRVVRCRWAAGHGAERRLPGSGRAWEARLFRSKARPQTGVTLPLSKGQLQPPKNSQKRPKHKTGSHVRLELAFCPPT